MVSGEVKHWKSGSEGQGVKCWAVDGNTRPLKKGDQLGGQSQNGRVTNAWNDDRYSRNLKDL